jgi:PAS domain S-box-containing protein
MQSEPVNPNDEKTQLLALQEAERRRSLCLAGAGLGIWTFNIATDEFWADDRAKHLHGHAPHEVHTFAEAGANIHPEDRDRAQAAIAEAIQTCSKLQIEYRVVWRDGSIRWITSQAEFVPSSQAGEGIFYGSVQDISERKRVEGDRVQVEAGLRASEARLATDLVEMHRLHELHAKLALETGLHVALEEILTTACEFTHTARGCVQLISEDGNRLEMYAWRGYRNDSLFIEHFRYESPKVACDRVRRHREPLIIEDIENFPPLVGSRDREVAVAENIRAMQSTPLITREGKMVGVLSNQFSQPHRLTDSELRLIDLLAWTAADFIARHRTEQALRESEAKYRSLFDSIDEGYLLCEVIFDENNKPIDIFYLEANPAAVRLAGRDFTGQRMREIDPNYEDYWYEIIGHVALTGETVRAQHYAEPHGRWFDFCASKVGGQESRRVASVFQDITERKRAEEAMRAFFSNVSHEFRTPLTLLLSSIREILGDLAHPPTPAQRSQLELAQRNAGRLLKLVNTLLDVSRIEAGHLQPIYKPTDLAILTTELASLFDSASTQAGLQLVIDCPPLPEPVYVDRSMWEKIVLNLLSNAFKFTFAGEIRVSLKWGDGGDEVFLSSPPSSPSPHVTLEVRDTGIGIAATELPRLFERFYQVKGANGRSFEGSGIGLSLVQELVKLHGGTIAVSSVEGEGSCFTVSIPTGVTHLPPEQIGSPHTGGFNQDASHPLEDSLQNSTLPSTATEASAYVDEALGWLPTEGSGEWGMENREKAASTPSSLLPTPSTLRILLVDDSADMRTYLKRLLKERWQVETAANGAIALTQIQQNPPDLVLTDVMMPEMNGLQLLQALRSNPQTQSIPVILLSARAGEEATLEGLETGADDYLIKPFSARELIARVETHLQLALLRQERSANRFKTEFLLTVTHELQAPLALILGWVRLLQTRSFDVDTTVQALATIERNATIEAKLVKDLLDVSGLLSGKVQLKSQVVELAPLLQSVITQFRAAAIAKQIQLVETVLNVPQRNVVADGDRFKQIIANLLENAIKFTPEGGQVTVQLECTDSEIYITVADTGIGIPPDFLPYVFDRFTQAEVPSRHSPGGVGIGLAIARLLVELHKGTIEVTSEGEGRGATFTVRLPLVNTVPNPNLTTPGR